MFAEDLLRDLRRAGYAPPAVVAYLRAIGRRVVTRVPRNADLVRSIAGAALALFAIQFAAALYFSATFGRELGISYLVSSSALLLIACFWIIAHLGLMRATNEGRLMRGLPFPVAVTLLRLVALPAIVLFVQAGIWSVACWIFVASALTDVLDGVLARALALETRAGKVLDPLIDMIFNLTIFVTLAWVRQLPWWVAALVIGRYALLVSGTFYLYVTRGPIHIQPTGFGKLIGVFTTSLVGLMLLGLAIWDQVTRHRLQGVFEVALGLLSFAMIIQLIFIGLANKKSLESPEVKVLVPSTAPSAKVVGEIRGPRL